MRALTSSNTCSGINGMSDQFEVGSPTFEEQTSKLHASNSLAFLKFDYRDQSLAPHRAGVVIRHPVNTLAAELSQIRTGDRAFLDALCQIRHPERQHDRDDQACPPEAPNTSHEKPEPPNSPMTRLLFNEARNFEDHPMDEKCQPEEERHKTQEVQHAGITWPPGRNPLGCDPVEVTGKCGDADNAKEVEKLEEKPSTESDVTSSQEKS